MTINHLGISGGKDSTALLLWAKYESGYDPESLVVTFCDTGNEHPYTYEYVRYLSERVHPIRWLKPELDFYELAKKKGRFPSARARFCTIELKIRPSVAFCHDLRRAGDEIVLHTGVRAAESADRALLPEREYDPEFLGDLYRPLLHWTLADVFAIHARHGIEPNPLYGLTETWTGKPNPFYRDGLQRVGCYPCIFSRKSEIARIARVTPERIDFIEQQERDCGSAAPGGTTTFFSPDKVVESQRSLAWTRKDGSEMNLCTIRDVERWAKTKRGGQQYMLDFPLEEGMADEPPSCSSRYGLCE